jgi:hypothetical protein
MVAPIPEGSWIPGVHFSGGFIRNISHKGPNTLPRKAPFSSHWALALIFPGRKSC